MSTLKENLTEILAEKQTYLKPGNLKKDVSLLGVTGTLEGVNGEEINITPSTSQQVITPTTGKNAITKATVSAVTSSIDANIIQSNIKAGVTILGVTGNVEPDKPDQTKTCTPTTSQQVIQPDTGYELASVTVNGVTSAIDSNITAGNIKTGTSILGVTGTYTSDATLNDNANLLSGNTAYANGVKYTGSMVNQGSKTFTPSASSQSASAGYYSSITCNAVSNLSAGNIKQGVTVGGTTGTYTSDATATASDIASGKTAYVNGSKITGSMTPGVEINEVVEQYQVATGQNISAGDFVGFIENYGTTVGTKKDIDNNYASGMTISAVKLDNNKVFVAYSKNDSYYYLNAVVLTISGTTITTGTSIQLSSEKQSGQGISTVKYDNENVYIFHCNTTNRRLYCMHVTIDGTTITKDYDTELNSNNYSGTYISAVKLSKNYIFIAHSCTGSYHLYASTIKINNDYSFTTCNNGTLLVSSMGTSISTTKFDENSVIIAHCSDANQTPLKIIKVSINNTATTITTDISDYSVSSLVGVGRNSQIIKLKNNRIVLFYGKNDAQQLNCELYSVGSSFSRLRYSQLNSGSYSACRNNGI